MDIIASVAFAQENNLRFCFKSSASRNQDLTSWSPEPFSFLFDESPYASLDGYVSFKDVNMDSHTIWNGDSKRIPEYGLDYAQLVAISGRYERLVLKQVWPLLDWENSANVVRKVPLPAPSENVLKVFGQVRARLPSEYNFLAYRYEHDFVNFFTKNYPGTNFPLLKEILALEPFSDPSLSTYLACSSPKSLSAPHVEKSVELMPNLLFTEEGLFAGSNYEIGAYVDFLVGINAAEVLGHSRSSFGRTLNNWKNTSNHYDLLFG